MFRGVVTYVAIPTPYRGKCNKSAHLMKATLMPFMLFIESRPACCMHKAQSHAHSMEISILNLNLISSK